MSETVTVPRCTKAHPEIRPSMQCRLPAGHGGPHCCHFDAPSDVPYYWHDSPAARVVMVANEAGESVPLHYALREAGA